MWWCHERSANVAKHSSEKRGQAGPSGDRRSSALPRDRPARCNPRSRLFRSRCDRRARAATRGFTSYLQCPTRAPRHGDRRRRRSDNPRVRQPRRSTQSTTFASRCSTTSSRKASKLRVEGTEEASVISVVVFRPDGTERVRRRHRKPQVWALLSGVHRGPVRQVCGRLREQDDGRRTCQLGAPTRRTEGVTVTSSGKS